MASQFQTFSTIKKVSALKNLQYKFLPVITLFSSVVLVLVLICQFVHRCPFTNFLHCHFLKWFNLQVKTPISNSGKVDPYHFPETQVHLWNRVKNLLSSTKNTNLAQHQLQLACVYVYFWARFWRASNLAQWTKINFPNC